MRANGMGARLSRLEDCIRPKGSRQLVVWWPGEPKPEVPEGGVLFQVVYEDEEEIET